MKRLLLCFFAIICVFCFSQAVFAADAEILNKNIKFTQGMSNINYIVDENRSTKLKISGEQTLKIESLQPVASLYLVWDTAPSQWFISTDDGKIIAGQTNDKFLHEYVYPFETPAGEGIAYNNLNISITDGVLCDIYFFSEGEAPAFVQKWNPPYNDADMLLLPTHADDEHLYFGGTMPAYSSDKKVQVAYFTIHSGEIYRQHELLDGLYAVGIRAYPVFSDFTDYYAESLEQAKGLYDEQAAIDYIYSLLCRFNPEVVIGHDVNGEYGHGVHKYNTYCLQKALEKDADNFDGHQVLKTYLHLYEENPIEMNWDIPLEQFQGKTAFEMAVEGFAKHKSQQKYFKVEQSGPYDCRKFGLYSTSVGNDVNKNDFFENITETMYSDYVEPPLPPVESTPLENEQPASSAPNAESKPQDSGSDNFKPWRIIISLCFLPLILLAFRKKKK